MEDLSNIALQALEIQQDIRFRFKNRKTRVEDFDLYTFEQVWGSTAGAFPGIGGCAMTSSRTWVFYPIQCEENCLVYFDGRFGYSVPCSEKLKEDIRNNSMASVSAKGRYL